MLHRQERCVAALLLLSPFSLNAVGACPRPTEEGEAYPWQGQPMLLPPHVVDTGASEVKKKHLSKLPWIRRVICYLYIMLYLD